jgi:hypothetical protein
VACTHSNAPAQPADWPKGEATRRTETSRTETLRTETLRTGTSEQTRASRHSQAAGPTGQSRSGWITALNTQRHRLALVAFMVVVLGHWAEHGAQAVQIWGLDWPRPLARGVLGLFFPVLVKSEALHYGYALVMLAGLWILRLGFAGRARRWWGLAFKVQVWHHFEHVLLLFQGFTGVYFFGASEPTSMLQLVAPRVELHLFYNTVVFLPMIVAMWLHLRPNRAERAAMRCRCAGPVAGTPVPATA